MFMVLRVSATVLRSATSPSALHFLLCKILLLRYASCCAGELWEIVKNATFMKRTSPINVLLAWILQMQQQQQRENLSRLPREIAFHAISEKWKRFTLQ